jgi:hypothetical protein
MVAAERVEAPRSHRHGVRRCERYGENIEDGVGRITSDMTDEECIAKAGSEEFDQEQAIEVRNLWRAVERLQAFCNATLSGIEGMDIYDYAKSKLPKDTDFSKLLDDDAISGWRDIPVGSNCGADCKQMIDRAAELLQVIDPAAHDDALKGTVRALNVAIYG